LSRSIIARHAVNASRGAGRSRDRHGDVADLEPADTVLDRQPERLRSRLRSRRTGGSFSRSAIAPYASYSEVIDQGAAGCAGAPYR